MGIIFSKLNNLKENCKNAIVNKIVNTRDTIFNKINYGVQYAKNGVVSTKDDMVASVVSVRNGIYGNIQQKFNWVCDKCQKTRDGVVRRKNRVKRLITDAKDSLVYNIVSTKNGIVNKYNNTKNYIMNKYTGSRNNLKERYKKLRDTRLNKWQKIKLFFLFIIFLWITYISMATFFDIYIGDYERVEERFSNIYGNSCVVLSYTHQYSSFLLNHLIHYGGISSKWLLFHGKILVVETYSHLINFKLTMYLFTKDCVQSTYAMFINLLQYLFYLLSDLFFNLWLFFCLLASHLQEMFIIFLAHLKEFMFLAWKHSKIWGKIGLIYLKDAVMYSKDVAKVMFIKGIWCFYYLITDFRHAAVDGFIWLGELSHSFSINFYYLVISSTRFLYYYSTNGSVVFVNTTKNLISWLYNFSFVASDALIKFYHLLFHYSHHFSSLAWEYLIYFFNNSSEIIMKTSTLVTNKVYHNAFNFKQWLVNFVFSVSNFFVSLYQFLVGFMNLYGYDFLYKLGQVLLNTTRGLAKALYKFFADLLNYLFKLFTVTADRLYNIIYTIFIITFHLVSSCLAFVRHVLFFLVFLMRSIFAVVAYSLVFLIKTYSQFLSTYNYYRETIFFFIIFFFTLYCISVAKDRQFSEKKIINEFFIFDLQDEKNNKDDDDDDNDDDDDDADDTRNDVDFESSYSEENEESNKNSFGSSTQTPFSTSFGSPSDNNRVITTTNFANSLVSDNQTNPNMNTSTCNFSPQSYHTIDNIENKNLSITFDHSNDSKNNIYNPDNSIQLIS